MEDVADKARTRSTQSERDLYDVLDAASLCVAAALLTLLLLGSVSVVRDVVTVAFTAFVPGWAVLSNWSILSRRYLPLGVALSLALLALVATVTLWLHVWHPVDTAEAECCAAIPALSVSLMRRDRAKSRSGHATSS